MADMAQSMNRYAYANGNPTRYTDPTGHYAWEGTQSGTQWETGYRPGPQPQSAVTSEQMSTSQKFWYDLSQSDSLLASGLGYAGRGFFALGDTITMGGLTRQDRILQEYREGKITLGETALRTSLNIAVSAPLIVATVATGGMSIPAQAVIAGVVAAGQQFAVESYEKGFEGRTGYSGPGSYVETAATTAFSILAFGYVLKTGGGAARGLLNREGSETLGTGLQRLTGGAREAISDDLAQFGRELSTMGRGARGFAQGWRNEAARQAAETQGLRFMHSGVDATPYIQRFNAGVRNALDEIRLYRGRALGDIDPINIADPRLVVDMPFVGKGKPNANAQGWLRDEAYYWKEILSVTQRLLVQQTVRFCKGT
jgi:hypothetical protein